MMRLCRTLLLTGTLLYGTETDSEALFLRRIADFWQEGEYQIAKTQMEEFIVEYPESPFSDALCSALGDLFLREKNYSNALNYYAQVQSAEFIERVFLNRMQCLYEMQWYATLTDECEKYLEKRPNLHVTYFLAIALYHQCLNASRETDQLLKLAERARPYFETLYHTELSNEIAQGYAHLCCILKDFAKSTEIYLALAQKNPAIEEEMLFQVALIQSEYDKKLAIETFDKIVKMNQKKGKEAAYNRMVLRFDLGQFEELVNENSLPLIPADRMGAARLFLGRSLLQLKRYEEAIKELKTYIETAPVSETLNAALLSLLDAAYSCGDLTALDEATNRLKAHYPQHPDLQKAYFSRAQLLKRGERFAEAKEQLANLLTQYPDSLQKAQVLFELIHLDYKEKNWISCYQQGRQFLAAFPEHPLAPFVWRYFASSSTEIAALEPAHKRGLIADLELFLKLPLSEEEKEEWQLLLAKTHYQLQEYDQATGALEPLKSPNSRLLLALCYRDGHQDIQHFCQLAEKSLSQGANLIDLGQIHLSLYNAYLQLNEVERAAQHLYEAFMAKADLKRENLLWLADFYYNQLMDEQGNFVLAARTASLLDKCKAALHSELLACKLAKVYSILGRIDDAIALLEPVAPNNDEAKLLLGENYVKKGVVDKAIDLFDAITVSCGTGRSSLSAAAALQGARLKLACEHPNLTAIATQLKNLVVQKNFEGEPLYLEAALDYAALAAKGDLKRKVALLEKTKLDFTQTDDLLSKDYHAARAKAPRKDRIYQGYMKLIDAEIFAAQGAKEKAKDLLLEMMNEPMAPALDARVRKLLTDES
ncbi:MAG: outer membrane protein assembly factor BamD [Chlamydiales bacterium]